MNLWAVGGSEVDRLLPGRQEQEESEESEVMVTATAGRERHGLGSEDELSIPSHEHL